MKTPTRLRAERLAEFLDNWEAQHGRLTADELARAAAELELAPPSGRVQSAAPAGSPNG
jgi:hypothetical protein